MRSYVVELECTYPGCGEKYSVDEINKLCIKCGRVLYARYDIESVKKSMSKEDLINRDPNMWRYFEMMPVKDPKNVICLGEGFTPIFRAENLGKIEGYTDLHIKDEGLNPTASFKARGMSAALSKAKELGIKNVTMPSAGNAAGAMAAYAAAGNLDAHVFMPKDAPIMNQKESILAGASLNLIDGLINDAGRLSNEFAEKENLFDVSTLKEPYRQEGKKTMGYEIAEQFGWELPDSIIYPTGGGTGIVGMWKAFDEMESLGWIGSKRPKMFTIQATGCAPIVKAFEENTQHAELWENASTKAAGMRVPVAVGDYLILQALRESGGGVAAIEDEDMIDNMKLIASTQGILPAPEGAATYVGLNKLVSEKKIDKDEKILLMNTGSAFKYFELM